MLPVDLGPTGKWEVDVDPILDGDDMDWLEEVDHLPTVKGTVRGVEAIIYTASGTSGYVRADSIPDHHG